MGGSVRSCCLHAGQVLSWWNQDDSTLLVWAASQFCGFGFGVYFWSFDFLTWNSSEIINFSAVRQTSGRLLCCFGSLLSLELLCMLCLCPVWEYSPLFQSCSNFHSAKFALRRRVTPDVFLCQPCSVLCSCTQNTGVSKDAPVLWPRRCSWRTAQPRGLELCILANRRLDSSYNFHD